MQIAEKKWGQRVLEAARVNFPGFKNPFSSHEKRTSHISEAYSTDVAVRRHPEEDEMFKAYIPNFLYKPPYGLPRRVNLPRLKSLSKNPYVFSVIKTLADEAVSVGWDIKVKKEFNDDGVDYSEKVKEIKRFLNNPNSNNQSFEYLLRKLIFDILELDSGVLVKVFNRKGEMKQIVARDGGTFLMNPDIYGMIGDRADFVMPLPDEYTGITFDYGGAPTETMQQIMKQYNILYRERASWYQYGWTAGSLPVPFGKREIVFIMQNPRSDSVYGRSPVEILADIIQNLIYGAQYYLDFYMNSNMPEGVISLIGAQHEQIRQFRDNWEQQFRFTDTLGVKRKRFFVMPITNQKVDFTQFAINPKDMDVLTQQDWFIKIVWMSFGVTASEMGFTEQVNKSTDKEQIKLSKRKALRPLLQVIAYHLNTQLINEFFPTGKKDGAILHPRDVPLELVFDEEDLEEEAKKLAIFEQKIRMGVMTPMMAAKELGIDIEELRQAKDDEAEDEPPAILQEEGMGDKFTGDLFQKSQKADYDKGKNTAYPSEVQEHKAALKQAGYSDMDMPPNWETNEYLDGHRHKDADGVLISRDIPDEEDPRKHYHVDESNNRTSSDYAGGEHVHLDENGEEVGTPLYPAEKKSFSINQQPILMREQTKSPKNPLKEMDDYIDDIGKGLLELVDRIPEHDLVGTNGTQQFS